MSYTVICVYVFKCDRCGAMQEIRPHQSSSSELLQRLGWETDGDMQICGSCAADVAKENQPPKIVDFPGSGEKAGQDRGTP